MKQKIFFIIFMLVWILIVIMNFILPKTSFSEQENRMLAKIPSFSFEKLVSGDYAEKLDEYINDHFLFRNIWLKTKSTLERISQKTENNGVYIGKDGYLFEKFTMTDEKQNHLDKIAERVNNFADNIDIPISFILVPNSIEIYSEYLPKFAPVSDQTILIQNFYKKLQKLQTIDVMDSLIQNKNYEKLYFKTDHHMTSYGSYLVYLEYCNRINIKAEPKENFNIISVSGDFLGTFDSKAQILNQQPDEIVVFQNQKNLELEKVTYDTSVTNKIYNEEYLSGKDKYSYFLNGNNAKVVIKTKVNNDKKILIIKDSYAHNMAQFFCQNYEEIHLIDSRYYGLSISEYAIQNDIDEILFLYNVSNIVSDLGLMKLK